MDSTLRLMAAEAKELRPGGETIVARLADVLVVQAVRAWLQTDSTAHPGWLRALRDPQIGRAVALAHREPERDWSVASLAAEATMSRSGFSARFSQIVGEPAMHYVTRVRMRVAERRVIAAADHFAAGNNDRADGRVGRDLSRAETAEREGVAHERFVGGAHVRGRRRAVDRRGRELPRVIPVQTDCR